MAVKEYVWVFGSDISLEPVSDLVGCVVVVKKKDTIYKIVNKLGSQSGWPLDTDVNYTQEPIDGWLTNKKNATSPYWDAMNNSKSN